jgi:hypothetical protein
MKTEQGKTAQAAVRNRTTIRARTISGEGGDEGGEPESRRRQREKERGALV